MWFYYLVGAIGVSVGSSVFVAIEIDQSKASTMRIEQPDTQADSTAQISRALRSNYMMNPGIFPEPKGSRVSIISDELIKAALRGGQSIPKDVVFTIDSYGRISSKLAANTNTNLDRYVSTLDKLVVPIGTTAMNIVNRVISTNDQKNDFKYNGVISEGISVGTTAPRIGAGRDYDPTNNPISIGNGNDSDPYNDGGVDYDPTDADQLAPGAVIPDYGSDETDPPNIEPTPPPTTGDTPKQYTDKKDVRYGAEREFDAYCKAVNKLEKSQLDEVLAQYKLERSDTMIGRYTKIYEDNMVNYEIFVDEDIYLLNRYDRYRKTWGMQKHYEPLYQEKKKEVDEIYRLNPDWKPLEGSKDGMDEWFTKLMKSSIKSIPTQVKLEDKYIADATEVAIEYCDTIYTMREDFAGVNVQANSAPQEERSALRQGTAALINAQLSEDLDFASPKTPNMKKLSKVTLAALGVRNIVDTYPVDPQFFPDD
jgi:hypothetical protein